jgi:hypothetical protein
VSAVVHLVVMLALSGDPNEGGEGVLQLDQGLPLELSPVLGPPLGGLLHAGLTVCVDPGLVGVGVGLESGLVGGGLGLAPL